MSQELTKEQKLLAYITSAPQRPRVRLFPPAAAVPEKQYCAMWRAEESMRLAGVDIPITENGSFVEAGRILGFSFNETLGIMRGWDKSAKNTVHFEFSAWHPDTRDEVAYGEAIGEKAYRAVFGTDK